MVTLKTLDVSILSLVILIFIYISSYSRIEKFFIQYKLFQSLVIMNIVFIMIDILGWAFNGLPGQLYFALNIIFNTILYIIVPIGPSIWVLYTDYQINSNDARLKKVSLVLLVLLLMNLLMTIASFLNRGFFYVDSANIYHRGSYFWIHATYCYLLITYSFFYVLFYRRKIEKQNFLPLLLYFTPQIIGTTIQMFDYGVSYNWAGMMLSLLIIYLNIQNRSLNTDYLTGVYNRRQLDGFIRMKIKNSLKSQSFSAIMLDLVEFKKINDTYGHEKGDEALKDAVSILRKSIRQNDLIARYGGDEFVVILTVDSEIILEQTINRIHENAINFNNTSKKIYKINFSIGYDIYQPKSKTSADDFLKHIDTLMYKNKNTGKSI